MKESAGSGCMPGMKKTILPLMFFCALLALAGSGCVNTIGGRTRAGNPIGKDRIESRYERSVDQLLAAAREVLQFNGRLYSDDIITKTLEAKIDTRTVWVKIDEVDPKVTHVVVQARKSNGAPDIALASEIDKQIALHLR